MTIQLLEKYTHKGKEYVAGEEIEVSNVNGNKLVKNNKAKLISSTKKKRILRKMKKGEIVEEKNLGVAFIFDYGDLADLDNITYAQMTFKAFYKTYLAICNMCIREEYDWFQVILYNGERRYGEDIYLRNDEEKTLAKCIAIKNELNKIFNSL